MKNSNVQGGKELVIEFELNTPLVARDLAEKQLETMLWQMNILAMNFGVPKRYFSKELETGDDESNSDN